VAQHCMLLYKPAHGRKGGTMSLDSIGVARIAAGRARRIDRVKNCILKFELGIVWLMAFVRMKMNELIELDPDLNGTRDGFIHICSSVLQYTGIYYALHDYLRQQTCNITNETTADPPVHRASTASNVATVFLSHKADPLYPLPSSPQSIPRSKRPGDVPKMSFRVLPDVIRNTNLYDGGLNSTARVEVVICDQLGC
jgi:hypothetical protein